MVRRLSVWNVRSLAKSAAAPLSAGSTPSKSTAKGRRRRLGWQSVALRPPSRWQSFLGAVGTYIRLGLRRSPSGAFLADAVRAAARSGGRSDGTPRAASNRLEPVRRRPAWLALSAPGETPRSSARSLQPRLHHGWRPIVEPRHSRRSLVSSEDRRRRRRHLQDQIPANPA